MTEDQFLETLSVAEAAADVTVRGFMKDHLEKYHAMQPMQLTTKQKLVVAGAAAMVGVVAAAATPQGRQAMRGATTKVRCKIARFFAPKEVNVHPEDPAVDFVDVVAS